MQSTGLRGYYLLKPYLPSGLRLWLRHQRAKRILAKSSEVWPIKVGSEKPPQSWPGWPQGKKFAFVLTHDVEGPRGYERVRRLCSVEKQRGFTSAFHFVPEGSYTVSEELLSELRRDGFEIGVHDLHHDGSLYASQANFHRQAVSIRRYLKRWNAAGFRAGFMFHNLDWIHELGCDYDLSTFDTDPFEPQPDGVGTLFPFWVANPGRNDDQNRTLPPMAPVLERHRYLEIPYTLPQDSTLFLVLRQLGPETWLKKLDWIASHGGMALLNVHPDYVQFENEAEQPGTYPLSHYTTLLDYVSERYRDQVWLAKPQEVHAWLLKNNPL